MYLFHLQLSKCGLHPCNFAKKWISRKKNAHLLSGFLRTWQTRYLFLFLPLLTHHFRLSIQPFHVGKVAVNRSFAVKLIPHEFYALDQWNFNPKKKDFFWSHSKVSSPSVNMMHVPSIHHCQIYGMLYKSSWPKYHG